MSPKIISAGTAILFGALTVVIGTTGCAGDRYHQSTGEAIDDHATSMRVKSALGDDAEYKYAQVEVKTFKGVAQLSGFVDTRAQKSHAGEIAKNVAGVREVENNISIKE
jgi:osmotically-inducible protein OsmY